MTTMFRVQYGTSRPVEVEAETPTDPNRDSDNPWIGWREHAKVAFVSNGDNSRFDVNCYFGGIGELYRIGGCTCPRARVNSKRGYRMSYIGVDEEWKGTGTRADVVRVRHRRGAKTRCGLSDLG